MENKRNIAQENEERLIDFASRVLDMVERMPYKPAAKHLGAQIMRSATSPALNYGEVRAAESDSDFVHKMKICLKELRETYVCLQLIERRKWFKEGTLTPLIRENNELIAIFTASLKTISSRMAKKS